jgi:hypothetical protein
MSASEYADLEIALSHHAGNQYRVELKFRRPGSDVVDSDDPGLITLDLEHLGGLDDPADHGQALRESVFGVPAVATRFAQARETAGSQTPPVPLRLRLRFDWQAAALHALRWETLRDPQQPGTFLSTGENTPLSRYLRLWGKRPVRMQPKGDLSALVVIANPGNVEGWHLAPVDVAGELARARAGLTEMTGISDLTVLCRLEQPDPACGGPPTLANLHGHLREGCDILYLVAHGRVIEGRPWVWLEDEVGGYEMITIEEHPTATGGRAAGLITRLRQLPRLPRLAVLASCQSAGAGDVWASRDGGALSALGPAFVEAGVPAVLAMQGDVTMESVARFMPAFFHELHRDGQIDRAVAAARTELDLHQRPDWWMPVLFMRLESGQLAIGAEAAAAGPFMAAELRDVVPRPMLMDEVLPCLLDAEGQPRRSVALQGFGGFGKTTLARAICHRVEVRQAFPDGILWATLGESPQLLQALSSLHAALAGEWQNFGSEDDAARALADQLDGKRCLLVIDDVWNPAHLQPFFQGGDGCVRLVTTRMLDVAVEATEQVLVEEMTVQEAAALLTMRLERPPEDQAPFLSLADRLGQWPLMLELAEAALRQRLRRGDSLEGALAYVNQALDEEGVVAFDQRNAEQRNQAIGNTIAVSLRLLSEEETERFVELAIFAQDVDIPLSALELLWGLSPFKTERFCELLSDLSLVRFDLQSGTIRLHDVMHAYLAERLVDTAVLHLKLVDAWGDPRLLPTPYAWRWIAYHLAEAARASATPAGRHALTERLVELALDGAFQEAHLRALRDPASLHEDLRLALQVAAEDPHEAGLVLLVRAARGLIAFRRERLAPAEIFNRAREGDVEAAMRQLALFSVEREWRQAAAMIVAWLAAPENPQDAQSLLRRVQAELPAGESGPLRTLADRASIVPGEGVWPEDAWLPTDVPREAVDAIIARMAGLKDKLGLPLERAYEMAEVYEVDPTVSSYEASVRMTADESYMLVAYTAAHPEEEHSFIDDHLAILAANSYVRYRNRFLWPLLDAVLRHPTDPGWAQRYAARIAEAALSPSKLEFEEGVAITVLGLQAQAGSPTTAWQQLDAYREHVETVARELVPDDSRGDSWGSYNRRLAALAQVYQLLDETGTRDDLLQLAVDLHFGFAGFTAPARLTLAETIRACGGEDWTARTMLDAAKASAHNVQEPTFCAQTTSRVNAMRERWWGSVPIGAQLGDVIQELCQHPEDRRFAAMHRAGESYPQRGSGGSYIPLPPWAIGANSLGELARLYGRPVEAFERLNPGLDPDQPPLPPWIDVPDPEMAPLVAARLAAEALVVDLAAEERVNLLWSLVPVAAANPTALDTVLSRLLVAGATLLSSASLDALVDEFDDLAQDLAERLNRDIPETYVTEGADCIGPFQP